MLDIKDKMMVDEKFTSVAPRVVKSENSDLKVILEKLEERDQRREVQLQLIQSNMVKMASMIQEQSRLRELASSIKEIPLVPEVVTSYKTTPNNTNDKNRMKPFKWPEPYDHTDSTIWNSTHGLLNYIYQRDVVEKGFLQSSDFFMQLFNHAVAGTAKLMITGYFEEMMMKGETWNGLGLLKEMDNTFRDKNSDESAAVLLHACKQFNDEALSSFLPRYQRLLVRSPSATSSEKQKSYQLSNALNKITQNYMIGREIPDRFLDFVRYLTIVGSQIERIGLVKTKVYLQGQVGTFDDGTRGIAGGKLLSGRLYTTNYQINPSSKSSKDANGDTRTTGKNMLQAKWVSQQEIERRMVERACLRCGKRGHLINKCNYLPAKRSETGRNQSKIEENQVKVAINDETDSGELKKLASKQRNVKGRTSGVCKTVAESQSFDDKLAEREMNGSSFVIDALINNIYNVSALIDNGCECLAAVNNSMVRKANLPRIAISPRKLTGAVNNDNVQDNIIEMTKLELDIDGYQKELYAYIIPRLSHELILGKPWMEREDVVYHAREHCIDIREAIVGNQPLRVREKDFKAGTSHKESKITMLSAGVFMATVRKMRKSSDKTSTKLFTVTLADIQKALAPVRKSDTDLKKLPFQYRKFADLFKKELTDKLPPHRLGGDHEIKVEAGKEVPWGPLYGMSRDELLVLRKTLTDLIDKNYIRVSSSPAGAPVLFVKKPGGGLRFCVDYRALNAITKADRYPLPLIKETLARLSKSKWFTKLDVRSAFHKLRIKEGDEWKTAFRTRFGLFEWLVMPFGLNGAPATFQRYINGALHEYLDDFCSAYVDDVLVYTNGNLSEHEKHVHLVLEKLQRAGLGLDIDKCEFSVKKTKYLGFIISSESNVPTVRMDPEKVRAISEWQAPTTTKGLRGFLGFANFYRGFISDYSNICAPLTSLTGKGTPWKWGPEQSDAFETLKSKFIKEPALAQYDPDRKTMLEADCSGYALGGCLLQKQEDKSWTPVAYYSRKLTGAEMNYEIHDKELLAVVACMKEWDAELRGLADIFTILTDHMNLKYFLTTKRLTERQTRWAEFLSRFRYNLEYRKGVENERADALSRRDQDKPKNGDPRLLSRERQVLNPINISKLKIGDIELARGQEIFTNEDLQALWNKGIMADASFLQIVRAVQNGERAWPRDIKLRTEVSDEARPLKATIAACTFDQEKGLLYYQGRLWVPQYEPLTTAIIQNIHDSPVSGHPGRDATLAQIARCYFWPGISKAVKRFCKNCHVCGRSSIWRHQKLGLLKPLPIPDRFHQELSIDFMVDLPESNGNTNIMVITDRLLKSVTIEPMNKIDAESCAKQFLTCHWRFHGFPKAITSDRGTNWTSKFWKRLCELAGIEQRLSTSYHPQTDGATERANQEVQTYLRAYVSYTQHDWSDWLAAAQVAINNRNVMSLGGISPFFATHGYHVSPIQNENLGTMISTSTGKEKAEIFVDRLSEITTFMQAAMAAVQERYKEHADKKRQPAPRYVIGDKVWLLLRNIKLEGQISKKLGWQHAKYTVTKIISPEVVELNVKGKIHNRFHVDLLLPASENPLPSQVLEDKDPGPIVGSEGEEEYFIDEVIKCRTWKGERQALVKWTGNATPEWTSLINLKDAIALDKWEEIWGPAESNNGPASKKRRG